MARRLAFAIGVGVLVALPLSVAGQQDTSSAQVLAEYRVSIEAYRAGEVVKALEGLLAHDRAWLASAAGELADAPGVSTLELETAALLHTEAVTSRWVQGEEVTLHLTAASQLINLRQAGRASPFRFPSGFRRDWYLVVAWYLQRNLEFPGLITHLETTTMQYPDDPSVLLTLGSFYEIFGWWSELPALNRIPPAPHVFSAGSRDRRSLLEQSERALVAALAASPDLAEARLRLGHVLSDLGRQDEALAMLTPLRARGADTTFGYLANLFAGVAEERSHRLDRAADAYRAAAGLRSRCQTPLIALSAVLRAQGDQDASYALVLDAAGAGSRCSDPWWDYRLGQWVWRLDDTLGRMRREVR